MTQSALSKHLIIRGLCLNMRQRSSKSIGASGESSAKYKTSANVELHMLLQRRVLLSLAMRLKLAFCTIYLSNTCLIVISRAQDVMAAFKQLQASLCRREAQFLSQNTHTQHSARHVHKVQCQTLFSNWSIQVINKSSHQRKPSNLRWEKSHWLWALLFQKMNFGSIRVELSQRAFAA